jgi:hypothetical protein
VRVGPFLICFDERDAGGLICHPRRRRQAHRRSGGGVDRVFTSLGRTARTSDELRTPGFRPSRAAR